jgi:hypothetical protein
MFDTRSTNADVIYSMLDTRSTNADVIYPKSDIQNTNADVIYPTLDTRSTNADVIYPTPDARNTNTNVIYTNSDAPGINANASTCVCFKTSYFASMNNHIDTIRKTRNFLLDTVKDLTIDQLNKVPAGMNNNIAWNLGHMVAAQQGVCYLRAGLAAPALTDEAFISTYKSGTKPERFISEDEIAQIKELFFSSLDQLEADYNNLVFSGYTAWQPRYGNTIDNIDMALGFLPFHEGMHTGCVLALKKMV